MRSLARTSLGLLSLALAAPSGVLAQNVPAPAPPSGYQQVAAPAVAPDGLAMPAPAPAVEAPHKHRGKTLCAKCAAKMQARMMPPGTIVGCEHSKNGVCTACQAALNMPGTFVMAGAQPAMAAGDQASEAPGRAVASSGMAPGAAASMARTGGASYGENMAEPAPVGVVQANFSEAGPMAMPAQGGAPMANPMMAPGRAMVESAPGNDPYQSKSKPFPRPHILGHLFGWSGLGSERADEKARRKAEAHAMISYDKDAAGPVEELPASMVFGKKR